MALRSSEHEALLQNNLSDSKRRRRVFKVGIKFYGNWLSQASLQYCPLPFS